MLRDIGETVGADVVDLDDLPTRDAVSADPSLFLAAPPPVLIDEFQHIPDLLDAIKAELNVDARPGRYVITGSTQYATQPMAAAALTGRLHRVDVRPLSQGEISRIHEDFVERLVEDPDLLARASPSRTSRDEYITLILSGGFPMALRRGEQAARARWFDDYIDLVIERDVMDISRVRQRRQLPRLLRQLASQTAQLLNIASAAESIDMDKSTAENYTKLLEAVFIVQRLPAWGTTLGSRVSASPKVHLVDTGLCGRLLRLTQTKLRTASAAALTEFGHLAETFVVAELSKQLDWLDEPVHRGHWRTYADEEVDLVIERGDGRVVAVEIKAGSRVRTPDIRGLRAMERRLGNAFLGGVVMYTDERAYSQGRIHVLPIDSLWTPRPE